MLSFSRLLSLARHPRMKKSQQKHESDINNFTAFLLFTLEKEENDAAWIADKEIVVEKDENWKTESQWEALKRREIRWQRFAISLVSIRFNCCWGWNLMRKFHAKNLRAMNFFLSQLLFLLQFAFYKSEISIFVFTLSYQPAVRWQAGNYTKRATTNDFCN